MHLKREKELMISGEGNPFAATKAFDPHSDFSSPFSFKLCSSSSQPMGHEPSRVTYRVFTSRFTTEAKLQL